MQLLVERDCEVLGMGVEKCDATIMRNLLRDKFSDTRRYALAEEVGNKTGYQRRRLDTVVVDVYQSNGYSLEGIEIKVSKADLRRELQDASKHNIFFDDLDYYSLAAPSDIIDKDLIPKHWGIYAAKFKDGEWTLRTVRRPCSLHDIGSPGISRPFFACLARALSCQSPTEKMLYSERQKGIQEGIEQEKRHAGYLLREAEGNLEELKAYRELFRECRLWGADSIERGIERFKAFEEANLIWLPSSLDHLIERATKVRDSLPDALKK